MIKHQNIPSQFVKTMWGDDHDHQHHDQNVSSQFVKVGWDGGVACCVHLRSVIPPSLSLSAQCPVPPSRFYFFVAIIVIVFSVIVLFCYRALCPKKDPNWAKCKLKS